MTYGLFEALLARHEAAERKMFIHTGIIAASVINFGFCRPDKPVEVEDFVPGMERKPVDLQRMTPEEQEKHLLGQFSKKEFRKG